MMKIYRALLLLSSLGLSACAIKPDAQQSSPQAPTEDQAPETQASTRVQTEYIPVPMPGQLMPLPKPQNQAPSIPPTQTVDDANKNATQEPNRNDFFNAMMTYNYMPGALYTIYTAPLHITDISLAPGEKLISEAAGDTLRWQVAQTYSGQGDTLTQHILVKPSQSGLSNTMVITTDQRVYHLLLQSTDDSYMAEVHWNYGNNIVSFGNNVNPNSPASTESNTPAIDLNHLNFNYKFGMKEGDKPSWYPIRIFNDGRQTYIQLPQNYDSTQLPLLFVADDNGNYGSTINWRYRAPYIIADIVIKEARLQTGVASTGQTIVQIKQTSS